MTKSKKIYSERVYKFNLIDKEYIRNYKYINDKLYFIGRQGNIYTCDNVSKDFEEDCNCYYVKENVLYKFEIVKREMVEFESNMNPIERIKENYITYSRELL